MRSGLVLSLLGLAAIAGAACSSGGGSTPADTASQELGVTDAADLPRTDTTPPDGISELLEPEVIADARSDALPLDCKPGQQHCLGSVLHVCQSATWLVALDCGSFGWQCKKGDCAATAAESATESAWRQRIVNSSVGMVLEPLELDSYGGWATSWTTNLPGSPTGTPN